MIVPDTCEVMSEAVNLLTIRWRHSGAPASLRFPRCRSCCVTFARTALSTTLQQIFRQSQAPYTKRRLGISVGIRIGTQTRGLGQRFMATVAGVDFGTLSVRVSIVDSERGMLASPIAEYPLHRNREDPEYATQSHDDHMLALAEATRAAVEEAGISGDQIEAIALDTTGSSVIPVGKELQPLGEYYLWCDHRAKHEAEEITQAAHRENLEAIEWCGGVYSSE